MTIFTCADWEPRAHFRVGTEDLCDAQWSPVDETIAVWDSLLYYRILLYSTKGSKIGTFSAYSDALGIKCVNWSPQGQAIAVGSYNQVPKTPLPEGHKCENGITRCAQCSIAPTGAR